MRFCSGLVLMLIFFSISSSAQKVSFSEKKSSKHTYVKGTGFEGVVFSGEFVFPFLEHQSGDKRFTPTQAEVEKAEQILLKNIESLNKARSKKSDDEGPVIDRNLDHYIRQYYGYFSDVGDRIVFISCLFKNNYESLDKESPNWLKGAVLVLNGGSNYWQVQANLTTSSLFGLEVNSLDRGVSP